MLRDRPGRPLRQSMGENAMGENGLAVQPMSRLQTCLDNRTTAAFDAVRAGPRRCRGAPLAAASGLFHHYTPVQLYPRRHPPPVAHPPAPR